jgi:hydrogenase expression/formation protein HypC
MCLAVPVRVVERLADGNAIVEVGGVRNRVSLALVDGVDEGDYVIVHAGFAIARLDVAEAEKSLALFAEIARALQSGHPEPSPAAGDPSALRASG